MGNNNVTVEGSGTSLTNMITGNIGSSIFIFALPMIIGNLAQKVYNMVDTIIVGQVDGQDALSAVGSTSTIVSVFVAIAIGFSLGSLIVLSQLYGAKNYLRLKTGIYTLIIAFLAMGVLCTIVGLAISTPVLNVVVNEALREDAAIYYNIYLIGLPARFVYYAASAAYNALGKSRTTLGFLLGSSILNVLLDLLFIAGFGWGVAGAAIATNITQYLTAVVAIIMLLHYVHKTFVTEEKAPAFEWKLFGHTAKVAVPTVISQLIVSLGYLALTSLINRLSVDIISGYVAATKITALCDIIMVQIGNAMATFTGQNVGAKKYERIAKGLIASLLMCVVCCVIFIALILPLGHTFIGWFMDDSVNEAAYTAGVQYLRITGCLYILMGAMYVVTGVIRGAGATIAGIFVNVCNFSIRVIFAYTLFAVTGSELIIWWSNPVGWFMGLTLAFIMYMSGFWKKRRVADKI